MIKPWVFEFFPNWQRSVGRHRRSESGRRNISQTYLDIWTRAETLGFEGIFFSEHHFGNAYSPSPNLLISAVAGRTKTLRLGVMGVVVPYYTPWRIYEEIAMLDNLTNGRIEIGTAVGIPQEIAQVGMSMEEARERNEEAMEILDALLSRKRSPSTASIRNSRTCVRCHGRVSSRRRNGRRSSVTTPARKAARRGSKISTAFNTTDRVKEIFDAYRDEADKGPASRPGPIISACAAASPSPKESEAKEMMDAMAERVRQRWRRTRAPPPSIFRTRRTVTRKQGGGFVGVGRGISSRHAKADRRDHHRPVPPHRRGPLPRDPALGRAGR